MPQNVYDYPDFFAQYNKLPRSQDGLDGAPEWPALRTLVGSVKDASLLDLGCGYGWFCRWACENQAARVHGIDVSAMMLAKARRDWPEEPAITYQQADLDEINLNAESYNLVYSSLAFHYIVDIKRLFQQVYNSLQHDGNFVFSIEHPLFTAPLKPRLEPDPDGQSCWFLNSYHLEGDRVRNWLGEVVIKQHRTLTTYLEALLEPGFRLTSFKEWKPNEQDLKENPDWAMAEMHRPIFLIVAARKD